jgi:threonine aldolase
LKKYPQVRITKPVQANVVFAELPREWNGALQAAFPFYIWKDSTNEARLMCSWDTTEADILRFSEVFSELAGVK